jgi:O-antigen/teichoic acid export membrane protein
MNRFLALIGIRKNEGRPVSLKSRLIQGGLGSGLIQAVNRLLALALGVALARGLGPDGYGVYAYAFAIMGLLMVVAEAGVPTLLMREVAASQARSEWGLLRGCLRRGTQLVALTASIVSLLGLVVLWWFADSLRTDVLYSMLLMLLVLPLTVLCKTLAHAMLGLHRAVVGQAADMLLRPLLVLLILAIVFLMWPEYRKPQIAMFVQLLVALVVLIFAVLVMQRLLPANARKADPEYKSGQWLKSALPFAIIGGAGIINNQADIIMIGWFLDSEDVGFYRVAIQGAGLVAFGLQAFNAVVAPQFSRLFANGDMHRLQRLVTSSARAILAVALPLAGIFVLAGDVIVVWVFGKEYAAVYQPLAILAVGQMINAGFGSVGFLLNMTGHEGITARILWQTAIVNVVLNALLIPPFGTAGAAMASAFSLIMWNALLYIQVRKRLGLNSSAIYTSRP